MNSFLPWVGNAWHGWSSPSWPSAGQSDRRNRPSGQRHFCWLAGQCHPGLLKSHPWSRDRPKSNVHVWLLHLRTPGKALIRVRKESGFYFEANAMQGMIWSHFTGQMWVKVCSILFRAWLLSMQRATEILRRKLCSILHLTRSYFNWLEKIAK